MTAETKLALYAFSLESAAFGALLTGPYFLRIVSFLTLHSAACAVAAGPVWRLMPERYRRPPALSLAAVFAVLFTVSFIGFAALAVFNVYLLRSQKARRVVDAVLIDSDRVESEVLAMPGRRMGESALRSSAASGASPEQRLKTVMLLSEIGAEIPKHIGLLKQSVKSADDSVRMFSFSMIDSMEKKLNDQIHAKLELYRSAPSAAEKAAAARELSGLYWEYVYTGLADQEYRDIMTREAENYAVIALRHLREDPQLLSILGRIRLARGREEEALALFREAMAHCRNPERFLPYVAEVHYRRGDYAEVRRTFAGHSGFTHDPALRPLVDLWTAS